MRPGNHCRITEFRNGIGQRSSVFLFTGEFIRCRHTGVNGIPEICTFRVAGNMSIISKHTDRRRSSGTRILSQCSVLRNSTPRNGQSYLKQPVPSMLPRLQSIMMDFRCMTVSCLTGVPQKWDRSGMYLGN